MIIKLVLILHVLGATIWIGGHLILSFRYLPKALRRKEPGIIRNFEEQFEPIGIPALIIQIVTGFWLAFKHYKLSILSFDNSFSRIILVKLLLLFVTVLLALHARLFIIPNLTPKKLPFMAIHIIFVTIISIMMLILGILFRFGGI